jgi:hypothetical protein
MCCLVWDLGLSRTLLTFLGIKLDCFGDFQQWEEWAASKSLAVASVVATMLTNAIMIFCLFDQKDNR